jgi:hypothetical protein
MLPFDSLTASLVVHLVLAIFFARPNGASESSNKSVVG